MASVCWGYTNWCLSSVYQGIEAKWEKQQPRRLEKCVHGKHIIELRPPVSNWCRNVGSNQPSHTHRGCCVFSARVQVGLPWEQQIVKAHSGFWVPHHLITEQAPVIGYIWGPGMQYILPLLCSPFFFPSLQTLPIYLSVGMLLFCSALILSSFLCIEESWNIHLPIAL